MNSLKLSDRLHAVADFVPTNARIADIGSDHAYLPVHLALNNTINFAIAGEVATGPFSNALTEIKSRCVDGIVIPRLADGLMAIHNDDQVDTVVIAGMGGPLIKSILTCGRSKLDQVETLILQPNVASNVVRTWLQENNYQLAAEKILEEDQHIYEILVAKRTANVKILTDQEIMFGPFLLQERNAAFTKKWQREKRRLEHVIQSISTAHGSDPEKLVQIRGQLAQIEEVLGDESQQVN